MQKVVDKFFKGKKPVLRYFIITYGPTGSGKSVIVNKVLNQLGISQDTTVNVLVDNIIEQDENYKKDVNNLVKKFKDNNDELQKELDQLYFKYRSDYADTLSSAVVNEAFVERYNIIFETTGTNISWTLKMIKLARENGYAILLVYPYVNIETLKKRLKKREKEQEDTLGFARKINFNELEKNVDKAQDNFEKLANFCDNSFIYQNSGEDLENIYILLNREIKYRGWCEKNDIDCTNGISATTRCRIDGLENLKMTDNLRDYIERQCKKRKIDNL